MTAARQRRGAVARKVGRRGEVLAALWLMAKGYRILAFRLRTPQGEIDLVVSRGTALAAVEVKRRTTVEAALDAVTPMQRQRLRRALAAFAGRRPRYKEAALRLDLIALAPGRRPRHIPAAWREDES